jgi:23S rRNA (uracil1939-C5)-methyltransferase
MLKPVENTSVPLLVERPVAGGRMLARLDGRVVFVSGAIPGEQVLGRVTRETKHALWAETVEVVAPSPDRRDPSSDPACGGLAYAHIRYERQLELKSAVIADAFRRQAKFEFASVPEVAGSPERGYRLRARLHVRHGRAGFFREGSHDLCDAAATGQLLPASITAVGCLMGSLGSRTAECEAVVVAENVAATERVLHLEPRDGARLDDLARRLALPDGVHGLTTEVRRRTIPIAGSPSVTDHAGQLFGEAPAPVGALTTWTRKASSFFQGNRYLMGALVRRVLELADADPFLDLYSGVGLFAVALAARGGTGIAVEGDRSSGSDLDANAAPWRERLTVIHSSVEAFATRPSDSPPGVIVLDPPRTGVSPDALGALLSWNAPRVVYVSCDPPTLARDAARVLGAGYALRSLDAFDLFPNTPHVETVACFER